MYLNIKGTNSTLHGNEVGEFRSVILYIHNGISIGRANKVDLVLWYLRLLRHADIFPGELDF
jgi:hypothetical protein